MVSIGTRAILVSAVLVLISGPAFAQRTLYVNGSTGNDSVSRAANSSSAPWRTIGRAAWGSTNRAAPNTAEAAQAGDTVQIAAGTYSNSGVVNNRWSALYNPVNQGTSTTNQITFVATGAVNITAPSTASPVIGCSGRNYVVWRGPFSLDEANISIHADTGTVVLHGATGCGVDGIFIDGDGAPTTYIDNHTGVRVEGCQSCFVSNSTIHDVRHPNNNHNGAAVMLYNSDNTAISHNNLYSNDSGVFVKGVFGTTSPQSGTVISFNLISGCGEGVVLSDSRDSRVYQNVIKDCATGVDLLGREPDTNYHPVNDWVVNNTIDNMTLACISVTGGAFHQNVRVWNNITGACSASILFETLLSGVDFQHNTYGASTRFLEGVLGNLSFLIWKVTYLGQDAASPASSTNTPRFVNAAGDDFRLCLGAGVPSSACSGASPVLGSALDLLDLDRDGSTTDTINPGAYVTGTETIGPGGVSAPPPQTTPSAPTNLRIVPGAE